MSDIFVDVSPSVLPLLGKICWRLFFRLFKIVTSPSWTAASAGGRDRCSASTARSFARGSSLRRCFVIRTRSSDRSCSNNSSKSGSSNKVGTNGTSRIAILVPLSAFRLLEPHEIPASRHHVLHEIGLSLGFTRFFRISVLFAPSCGAIELGQRALLLKDFLLFGREDLRARVQRTVHFAADLVRQVFAESLARNDVVEALHFKTTILRLLQRLCKPLGTALGFSMQHLLEVHARSDHLHRLLLHRLRAAARHHLGREPLEHRVRIPGILAVIWHRPGSTAPAEAQLQQQNQ